ncbi:hypothetical protein [Lysobacter niastensis]|uniref:Beta-barrel assembly machine subunit BamC n=1 Tax=Lysobacter niastensis TaxID=380629 RepID=A0ABS0B5Y9_9GAMM|nr:hypothetical protein [Lysobacter niastensis]
MRFNATLSRAGTVLLIAGMASGCSWFHKTNDLYAQAPEMRPLEVPPDLDQPSLASAVNIPQSAASPGAQAGAVGFTTTGTRDEVFARVGEALAAVDGLTIASSAEAMGVYDVNYEGSNFLVRVVGGAEGAYVSAVDPRGTPASGDAPRKLIDSLRTSFTGQ